MKAHLPIRAALMGLCFSLLATGEAKAYTFTKIADTNDSLFSSFEDQQPSINDSGTVAFRAGSRQGIVFTGNGGATTPIFNTFAPFSLSSGPAINNSGTVVFIGGGPPIGNSVFILNNDTVTRVTPTLGNFSPSLNDNGTIAVVGFPYSFGSGIYAGTSEPFAQIAFTASPLFSQFGGSSINNAETVAFVADLNTSGLVPGLPLSTQGIFTTSSSGGPISFILDTSGPFSSFGVSSTRPDILLGDLSLNDAGAIAFLADLDAGGQGIFKVNTNGSPGLFGTISPVPSGIPTFVPGQDIGGASLLNNGIITAIADTSGPFSSFGSFSLNNQGTTAFLASLDTGVQGIFTGADPVANKIITVGDRLGDFVVTKLDFSQTGLNNVGQVAFYAELANGTRGIFRANPESVSPPPKSVPEPTSVLGFLAFGAVSLVKRKQKKQLNSAS